MLTSIVSLLAWLSSQAIAFSPPPRSRTASCAPNVPMDDSGALLRQSQQGHDVAGFHYDQEPRGTSYISQVSKRDLAERRQMRRNQMRGGNSGGGGRGTAFRAPNSRGAFPQVNHPQQVNNYQNVPPRGAPGGGGYAENMGPIDVGVVGGNGSGGDFDSFRDDVSTNLRAMTDLLREMKESQYAQGSDVHALERRVADMSERLSRTERGEGTQQQQGGTTIVNDENSPGGGGGEREYAVVGGDKKFGTSLDGKFNQNIKEVIDEFDIVDRDMGVYDKAKIAQLEAKINKINEELRRGGGSTSSMQEDDDTFDTNQQMEGYVDLVNRATFEPPPPPEMPFMEEVPLPPPDPFMDEFPPPMPPPLDRYEDREGRRSALREALVDAREALVDAREALDDDDGRTYYQERNDKLYQNYNDPMNGRRPMGPEPVGIPGGNVDASFVNDDGRTFYQERNYNLDPMNPPPPMPDVGVRRANEPPSEEIPSFQKQQQQQSSQRPYGSSVNGQSGGHHYQSSNTSFMSAFSKSDNERRRQFDPWNMGNSQQRSVNEIGMRDRLQRGVAASRNRQFGVGPPMVGMVGGPTPPPPMEYFEEEPFLFEEGPMQFMEEECFYDEMW